MSSKGKQRKTNAPVRRSLLPLGLLAAGLALLVLAFLALRDNPRPDQAEIQVQGEPRLQVDQEVIDHGDVKLGTVINDRVRLTNVGDQPLMITERPYIEVLEGC